LSFRRDGGWWQVSIIGEGATGHGGAKTNTGQGRWDLVRAGHGKFELAAMAGALGAAAHSRATAAVVVKPATVLATSPYDNDQTREREVGDATVMAGHGRAKSSAVLHSHGGDGDMKCRIT